MELNKGNFIRLTGIIFMSICLYVGLQHFNDLRDALRIFLGIISPFILGGGLAFVLNVPMRAIENVLKKLFSRKKKSMPAFFFRITALLVTLIFFTGLITAVLFLVVPELIHTTSLLIDKYPGFVDRVQKMADDFSKQYPQISVYLKDYEIDWSSVGAKILSFFQTAGGDIVNNVIKMASSVFGVVLNFIIGFVFAINILLTKEKLGRQIRKIVYAYLPERRADRFLTVAHLSDKTFSNFLSGQCLEACILGSMFLVGMSVFRFPHAVLISILIAVFALIPMIGSFIGCCLGTFFILIIDPQKALWFLVLFLVIQQIEGNLIYPKVVGNSIGLPSMWVLVAITIGGNVMGIPGMLIFIPLASVLYVLLREAVDRHLARKKIPEQKLKS